MKMKFPSICKKSKPKGLSWKMSLFNHFKAISLINKPKSLKHSNSVLSDSTAKFISTLDCSWSQTRRCFTVPKDSEQLLEMAIEALRSNRLFFEPGNTGSILEAARFPFKDCVALALETVDPYVDFRVSMEEIVEACGLKEQQHLEDLLGWYLKMNRKKNHGVIVGAFIDMFANVNSCSSSSSCFISVSSSASPSRTTMKASDSLRRDGENMYYLVGEPVTKKSDISDFYFNLGKNVAYGADNAKPRKPELRKPESEKDKEILNRVPSLPDSTAPESSATTDRTRNESSSREMVDSRDSKLLTEDTLPDIAVQETTSEQPPPADQPKSDHHKRGEDAVAAARERFLARKKAKVQ